MNSTITDHNSSIESLLSASASDKPLAVSNTSACSQLFTARAGHNPLIMAAAPLFALLARLRSSSPLKASSEQNLIREFFAFVSRASGLNYAQPTVEMARNMLATCFSARMTLSKQSILQPPPTFNFYKTVLQCLATNETDRDLLEFAYYCLSTGYYDKNVSYEERATLVDTLYERLNSAATPKIRQQKKLSQTTSSPKKVFSLKLFLIYIFIALLFIVTFFATFCGLLTAVNTPLSKRLSAVSVYSSP